MHLKSLTLRGFKSFAGTTTLHLEPGMTCVVGPNGSGKSNVVDAIAWVLGEQGAKALRGGKMEDVIFAGSPGRPALGRAEVLLTIDNSDGTLPIDYAEVTIGRLMYRSGESEYAINGSPCRLLDVQELLSDTGIGREMHVVVGQGSLDAVLAARPEDRRSFVEEAAGVLKHRKRKERALRKLDSTAASLARLEDLSAELRRQLGPLGRQAEAARKAGAIQATLRDARLRLLADDLGAARAALTAGGVEDEALGARLMEAEAAATASGAEEAQLHEIAAADRTRTSAARDTWHGLTRLGERLAAVEALATQRVAHYSTAEPERAGRDPEALEAEADQVAATEAALAASAGEAQDRLDFATRERAQAEQALNVHDAAVRAAARAVADRREGLAKISGSVEAARSRLASVEAEDRRLATAATSSRERAAEQERAAAERVAEMDAFDEQELALDRRHETASATLAAARDALAAGVAEESVADRDRVACTATRAALALSLQRKDGAAALLADPFTGLLGSVADVLQIEPGAEAAVAAALGAAADGLAVQSTAAAVEALRRAAADDARVAVLVGGASTGPDPGPAPAGARWARGLVTAPPALSGALDRLLVGTVVVEDLAAAEALASEYTAVTRSGDVVGPAVARGGAPAAPSLLQVHAAHAEAEDRVAAADARVAIAATAVEVAQTAVRYAQADVDAALVALHDSDAAIAALQDEVARHAAAARAATEEAERTERARETLAAGRSRDAQALTDLEARLAAVGQQELPVEPSADERVRLAELLEAARGAEVEARLTLRTAQEQARNLRGRADGLRRAAGAERAAREKAEQRRRERSRAAGSAQAVAELARTAAARLAVSLEAAAEERSAADRDRAGHETRLLAVREQARRSAEDVAGLRDERHREQMARTELRLRVEALEQRTGEEAGMEPNLLIAEYGPELPVPPDVEGGEPTAYDRATQEQRAAEAERRLARLGKVNPLALEEFAALQERSAFLAQQVEDLQRTRKELLGIVRDVDARVLEVMGTAFADTAREFEIVFPTLFPGGEGRLVLTDPENLLTTGIEVEVRPAGKRVSRLSLLSGGERSMAALAFLLAVFRARPSPFYILDEVEAALDDRNLGRLLEAFDALRQRSQLLVVTHQKRTMEIADSLYGVTMHTNGVTTVISQRLREAVPA
ncbi:MAG TPA: chromosome segregation protein SMC [Frankiaceae bacterium]|nr:chromosome segregation protein SMC [Frankiaceae bacterium]